MKKTLLSSFLCLLSVAAVAQNHQNVLRFGLNYKTPDLGQRLTPLLPEQKQPMTAPEKGNNTQAFTALGALNFFNPVFGYFMPATVPMVYDKSTKLLYLIYNEQTSDAQNNIGVNLKLFQSATSFKSFSSSFKLITTSTVDYSGMPQLAVMNPNNATTTDGLNFMAMVRQYPQSSQYRYTSPTFYLKTSSAAADPFPLNGPERGNGAGYNFGAGGLVSFWNSSVEGFVHAGVLDPPDESAQYGQYGAFVYAASTEDAQSSIPTTWNNSQFRAAPDTRRSFNGPMYCDADASGACYAAVNSIFTDDETSRVIGVSKSTDLGKTWSDFAKMPATLYADYATSRSMKTAQPIQAYQQDAFIVTDENRYSYFLRVALFDDADALQAIDIVEAENVNGSWTMRPVASLADVPTVFVSNDSVNSANGYSTLKAYRILNPLGNEIEVARTADGNSLVVKWIDYNTDMAPSILSPAQTVMDQDQTTGEISEATVDSVFNTDIFITTRQLSSSDWNDRINVTNDKVYDIGTHMPRTVPSLSAVPLISSRAVDKSKWTGTSEASGLYKKQQAEYMQRIYNLWSNVYYGIVVVSSVEDEATYTNSSVQVSAPTPNPANNEVELGYTTTAPGTVTASISNILGEKVATVFTSTVDAGVHAFTFNTSNLPTGSYYLTVSINGVSQTKPVIVRH